jgi:hypothetical protein
MGIAGMLLVVLMVLAIAAALALRRVEPFLRAQIVASLEQRLHARVELDGFHVSLVKGIEAEGHGLRIWPPAQGGSGAAMQSAPADRPIIALDEFHFHAPLRYRPGQPVRIHTMELKGLRIDLPPKARFAQLAAGVNESARIAGGSRWMDFTIDSIECNGVELVLETDKPAKQPLAFEISRLKLAHITTDLAAKFETELTIPEPLGKVESSGTFGPWNVSDPGESAISGDYRLKDADLASFKGIAGTLNSNGHYQGTLRDVTVDGETETPDFRLTHFGNALALHTRFHASVDATNGDTQLDNVDATVGNSHLNTSGKIVRAFAEDADGQMRRPAGHDIALDVDVDHGRIEDFLLLASHGSTPLLTGDVKLKTTLHIPPGPAPIHERLALNGDFHLDQARFNSAKIQDRIRELSLRGQGRPGDVKTTDPASIQSSMEGNFTMAGGVITLPDLDYTVPGAQIELTGTYGVEGGTLKFAGDAKMQATVSQMVGGWLGALLSPADRLLKKNGAGTDVPIRIQGTRESPDFAIDFGRMKTTSPQRPGTQQ